MTDKAAAAPGGAREVKISCRNIWKVYGPTSDSYFDDRNGAVEDPDGAVRAIARGRPRGRRERRHLRRAGRRDLHHHGAFRLRQVDHGALPVPPGRADGR